MPASRPFSADATCISAETTPSSPFTIRPIVLPVRSTRSRIV